MVLTKKKILHKAEKAEHRADRARRAVKKLRRGNDYLASLANPASHRGARIPDENTMASATAHTYVSTTLDPKTYAGSVYGLVACFGPTLRDNFLYQSGNAGLPTLGAADWNAAGTVMTLGSTLTSSAINEFVQVATNIRPVSFSLKITNVGPALNAKGNYTVALVSAGQPIVHSSALQYFFDGSLLGASQLANARTFAAAESSEITWVPEDNSTLKYATTENSASEMNSSELFYSSATSTGPRFCTSVSGVESPIAMPWIYFCAQDLNSDASFLFELHINWEYQSRLSQLNSNLERSIYDSTAMEHAMNIAPMLVDPKTPEEAKVVSTAAARDAKTLAGARGTPKEHDVKSGDTFLDAVGKGLTSLGTMVVDNLPAIGSFIAGLL